MNTNSRLKLPPATIYKFHMEKRDWGRIFKANQAPIAQLLFSSTHAEFKCLESKTRLRRDDRNEV